MFGFKKMTSICVQIIKYTTGSSLIYSRLHIPAPIANVISPYERRRRKITLFNISILREIIWINLIKNGFTNSSVWINIYNILHLNDTSSYICFMAENRNFGLQRF